MISSIDLINSPLLTSEIDFMRRHLSSDVTTLLLKGQPTPRQKLILSQVAMRQRIEKKLPTFYHHIECILPALINLEQSSSEKTAAYKASLCKGERAIDLTAGMGIDSFFLSRAFKQIMAIEQDVELATITQHNLCTVLGASNIRVQAGIKAEDYLEHHNEKVDLIFVDPARRSDKGGKVFRLQDCTPNVLDLLPIMATKTKQVLIKTSPILDTSLAIQELQFVKECHIVEADGECKELLFLLDFAVQCEPTLHAINLSTGLSITSTQAEENNIELTYAMPQTYIYEPSPAMMKSGLFKSMAKITHTQKLHPNSQLYTSCLLVPNFPGRSFELLNIIKPNSKEVKTYLPSLKANLSIRNYPGSVAELTKKLRIKEGGDHYLFATTLLHEEKVLLLCKKI